MVTEGYSLISERMLMMIKKAIAFLLITFGLLGAFPAISYGQYTGVISVDNVTAEPGTQVAVPVRLSANNRAISSIIIPMKFDGRYLTYDSVSFVGSINAPNFIKTASTDLTGFRISYFVSGVGAVPTITASEAVLATIYFSVAANAPATIAVIDSTLNITSLGENTELFDGVNASDPVGDSLGVLYPDFQPGAVDIQLVTAVDDEKDSNLPAKFALGQNYPNPFNPSTIIEFSLPKAGHVKLEVFNILGQIVNTLIDQNMVAGVHRIEYDGSRLPSGIYFYRLIHAEGTQTRKMVLVK